MAFCHVPRLQAVAALSFNAVAKAESLSRSRRRSNTMLPKSRRISRAEVKTFVKNNHRNMAYHGHFLSLFLYKKPDISATQFSFSVSKKVAKSAVVRNKLRRQGYTAIENILNTVTPGFYCMFNFKKGSSTLKATDISKEIHTLVTTAFV
jgi:ribonuclease P protein component